MAFRMASEALPFTEGNLPYHHVHTPPPDPRELCPELPDPLARLILRCLRKRPESRPTVSELAACAARHAALFQYEEAAA